MRDKTSWLDEVFVWLVLFFTIVGVMTCCKKLFAEDVVTIQGNKITIVGAVTQEEKTTLERLALQRKIEAIKIVSGEIARAWRLQVEKAKIEVLGRLQELGATRNENTVINNVSASIKARQKIEQSV